MADRFTALDNTDPTTVGGYALRARIGAGGMGRVYLAFTPGGRALAVKVVRPDYADDPEFRRRFKREISAARSVQGMFTAPVVDADSEARVPWLATAYVPGPSLAQAVSEHGPLPQTTVFRLVAGVAEGLSAIHARGLVHRDLKPANILLADDGPRVIDFGIAHAANATSATTASVRVGTPAYMAPEQIRGRPSGPATDVFALGSLALYAATGRAAFGEGNTDALFYRILHEDPDLSACPNEVRPLVRRCLAKRPADRPSVEKVLGHARRRTGESTSALMDAWLPRPLVSSLAAFDTARYTEPAGPRKRMPRGTVKPAPRPKQKSASDLRSASPSTPGPKSAPKAGPKAVFEAPKPRRTAPEPDGTGGFDRDLLSGIGYLLGVAAVVATMAIGPDKVIGWFAEDKPVAAAAPPSPTASTPARPPAPSRAAGRLDGTGAAGDRAAPRPVPAAEAETPATRPDGCAEGAQAFVDNGALKDENEKLTPFIVDRWAANFDDAAGEADDADISNALRDLADDSRALSAAYTGFDSAMAVGNTWVADQHRQASESAGRSFSADVDHFNDLCE